MKNGHFIAKKNGNFIKKGARVRYKMGTYQRLKEKGHFNKVIGARMKVKAALLL